MKHGKCKGVNLLWTHNQYRVEKHTENNNFCRGIRHKVTAARCPGARCTATCPAPLAEPLHDIIGLRDQPITTVHATQDQVLTNVMHEELRRARRRLLDNPDHDIPVAFAGPGFSPFEASVESACSTEQNFVAVQKIRVYTPLTCALEEVHAIFCQYGKKKWASGVKLLSINNETYKMKQIFTEIVFLNVSVCQTQ